MDRFRIQRNRLKIVGVKATDNGVYSCRARSLAGLQAESKDAYLLNLPGRLYIGHRVNDGQLNLNCFWKYFFV